MSTRLFTVLFAALFLTGVFPVLFVQSFGSASAGVTAGFLLPTQDIYIAAGCIFIGLISTLLANEAILVMPLCTLLLLIAGCLTEVNETVFSQVHDFILGAIILFAMSVGTLKNKMLFFYVAPVSIWAFITGSGFMRHIPSITTPLFFIMGATLSVVLLLAIGVATGITLADRIRESGRKFKASTAFSSFLSLF